jgi:hypothetical protein
MRYEDSDVQKIIESLDPSALAGHRDETVDQSSSYIKWVAVGYVVVAGVVVALAYWWHKRTGSTQDEFVKMAGVGVSLVTALLSAVVSFIVVHKQIEAGAGLENLKDRLGRRNALISEGLRASLSRTVAFSVETLKSQLVEEVGDRTMQRQSELTKQVNAANEKYKNDLAEALGKDLDTFRNKLSVDLEIIKSRMGAERIAYDELSAAANQYYYTIATLEIGKLDQDDYKSADRAMVAATRYLRSAAGDKDLWRGLWQQGRSIAEKALKLPDDDARKQLWRERVKEFGGLLNRFEQAAEAKDKSPTT